MKLALLDDYQGLAESLADWGRLRARGVEVTVFERAFASQEEAARALAPFEILVLMRERTPMPRALLERLPNLRFIALTGLRSASLDLAACTGRGIVVSRTRAGAPAAVTAELTFLLILAAARDFVRAGRNMRDGLWHEGIRGGTLLEGRRLGVIGLGTLGRGWPAMAARSAWRWWPGARTSPRSGHGRPAHAWCRRRSFCARPTSSRFTSCSPGVRAA